MSRRTARQTNIVVHEEDLVNFLVESATMGYGRTRRDVLDIVSRMRGIKNTVTMGWWNKFNPVLSEQTPASLSIARAKASSKLTPILIALRKSSKKQGFLRILLSYFTWTKLGLPWIPYPGKQLMSVEPKMSCPFAVDPNLRLES